MKTARREAYTLLEMIVVITIMGIMLVLAIPSMQGLRDLNRRETAARDLATVFRYARGQAIFDERTVETRLDIAGGRYRLDMAPTEEEQLKRIDADMPRYLPEERIRRLPEGVSFADVYTFEEQINEAGHVVVEFFPNGTATPLIVALKDKKGRAMTVELSHATGRTKVYRGAPKNPTLPGQGGLVREDVFVEE